MDSKVAKPLSELTLEDIPRDTVVARGSKGTIYGFCVEGKLYCLKECSIADCGALLNEKTAMEKIGECKGVPGLVKTFKDDEKLYILKRFACGCSLEKLFYAAAQLPEDLTLHIARSLANILQEVHHKGHVYRDLKADNVVINKQGEVYLIDMGFCTEITADGIAPGYGAYHARAPEVLSQGPDGFAIDWWCLGILLYELAMGKPPHGYIPSEDKAKSLLGTPIDLTPLPPRLRSLIDGLLDLSPSSRLAWDGIRDHPSFECTPDTRASPCVDPFIDEIEMQTLGMDETQAPPTSW